MTRWMLDATADTLPPGLIGTPFEAVYRALREVAAGVWDVDPAVYRAGIAWAFYLLERPALLERFPALVAAALVSEGAPAIRPGQTPDELVALLRVWFSYRPTYARLEALLACYGVEAEVRPVSDPDCQLVCPVSDTRLAFYIRVLGMDWARPLTADEIAEIARLASPLGARPVPFYALQAGEAPVYVASAGAGIVYSLMSGAVAQAVPGIPVGGTIGTESQTVLYMPRVGGAMEIGAPVRNPKDFELQTDSVPLDFGGAVIPGDPVRNPKDFVISGSMPLDGGTVSEDTGIDIDCYWGDTVTIPAGYTVQSVKSTKLYTYCKVPNPLGGDAGGEFYGKLRVYLQGSPRPDFTALGITTSYFGVGISPLLSVFAITDVTTSVDYYYGYSLTLRPNQSGGELPVTSTGRELNSNGYVFDFVDTYSDNNKAFSVYGGTQEYTGFPSIDAVLMMRLYDANDTLQEFCFDVPSTIWSFSNGQFNWIDDTDNYNRFKYFYTTHGNTQMRIHCVKA